jgi:hypothetical protein
MATRSIGTIHRVSLSWPAQTCAAAASRRSAVARTLALASARTRNSRSRWAPLTSRPPPRLTAAGRDGGFTLAVAASPPRALAGRTQTADRATFPAGAGPASARAPATDAAIATRANNVGERRVPTATCRGLLSALSARRRPVPTREAGTGDGAWKATPCDVARRLPPLRSPLQPRCAEALLAIARSAQ